MAEIVSALSVLRNGAPEPRVSPSGVSGNFTLDTTLACLFQPSLDDGDLPSAIEQALSFDQGLPFLHVETEDSCLLSTFEEFGEFGGVGRDPNLRRLTRFDDEIRQWR